MGDLLLRLLTILIALPVYTLFAVGLIIEASNLYTELNNSKNLRGFGYWFTLLCLSIPAVSFGIVLVVVMLGID